MYLNFEVRDGSNKSLGETSLVFDWRTHVWAIREDKTGVWKRVASVRSGKFEFKEWGVMWMNDNARTVAIVHDSPKGENDAVTFSGLARLFDPVDAALKDTHAAWKLEMGSAGKVSMVMNKPLPFSRNAYIQRLNLLFPAPYLSTNYDLLADSLRKDDPKVLKSPGKYTTCGSLPGFISKQVALSKGMKGPKFNQWMTKYSLNGTNRVRDMGLKLGCWVESAPDKKPKPGDIYVLLDRGKTDKKTDGVSHVGVFECEIGTSWRTFDLGQGGGFEGSKNTRLYKPETCELYGESNQGGGFRTVAGWVDLERYFGI